MASIVKRKSKYSVVYTCEDENGVKRQKWETFSSNAAAKKRKTEVEFQQNKGTFIVPTAKTVSDLLTEYVSIYGVNTWALSTYEARRALIDNYVNPVIGDKKLDDISPRMMDKFYRELLTMPSAQRPYSKNNEECVSPRRVREIHKLLRSAFNQAVKWELMARNPVEHATLPKAEESVREIWDVDTLLKALDICTDDILTLAISIAFACSLRMGEMLGLTWDCVEMSNNSIENQTAFIYVDKELQRVSKAAMQDLGSKDIMKVFPAILSGNHTALVLKTPKTKTSTRRIYLPETVARLLQERKAYIEEMKDLMGDEFVDHNLVFCGNTGHPIEGQIINRALGKLIKDNDLPKIVFHSLRHSSITYKLKINGGDIKAVQGDAGHAQASKMTIERYSHIVDEDRRFNAKQFDDMFFGKKEKPVQEVEQAVSEENETLKLLKILESKPELLTTLKALAQAL